MKEKCFGTKIAWEENVLQTITASLDYIDGNELCRISDNTIISSQTFPQDYNFSENKPEYVCGMSVPPIMIKRIVERMRKAKMI